ILLDLFFFFLLLPRTPRSTLFPYTTLFRSLSESQSPGGKDVDSLVRGRWFAKPGREGLLIAVGLVKLRGEGGAEEHNGAGGVNRSEEHTSELQSRSDLVCRLLLEKKKKITS